MVKVCPFAEGWKNTEGWIEVGDLDVCLDFDEYCTICKGGEQDPNSPFYLKQE